MMMWIRSFLFSGGFILAVLLYTPLSLPLMLFSYRLRYQVMVASWTRVVLWWLKVTCGITYRIEGIENIPTTPAIVMSKHQSTWETVAFQRILPPQTWVLKQELLRIPFFGWALRTLNPIAIDRASGKVAMQQVIEQGKARLEAGIWVIIFPEGTRVAVGKRQRYRSGGAVLAEKTGYPILPIAHNAGYHWPRNGLLKQAGTIQVIIGKPIDPTGKTAEELIEQVETWIEATMLQIAPPITQDAPHKA